jgi:hypothetical protein
LRGAGKQSRCYEDTSGKTGLGLDDWKPAGTKAPRGVKAAKWDGTYVTNDGQVVLAEDAANLADALERAMQDDFDGFRQSARPVPR